MIKFEKPINLNGAELLAELSEAGVFVNSETSPFIDGAGDFFLDIQEKDYEKAKTVVNAHNGTIIPPDITALKNQLLEKLGITEDEAKLLLS
jgi:hypothetical protein